MKQQIIEVLEDKLEALDIISLNDLLNLKTPEELKELENILEELYQENIVYKTNKDKYILYKNCPNFRLGKIDINKKGSGFLLLDKEKDIYIPKEDLNGAINDDYALVELNPKDNTEGRVVRVLDRNLKNLIGEIYHKNTDMDIMKLEIK